jgi:hypothetical protein
VDLWVLGIQANRMFQEYLVLQMDQLHLETLVIQLVQGILSAQMLQCLLEILGLLLGQQGLVDLTVLPVQVIRRLRLLLEVLWDPVCLGLH